MESTHENHPIPSEAATAAAQASTDQVAPSGVTFCLSIYELWEGEGRLQVTALDESGVAGSATVPLDECSDDLLRADSDRWDDPVLCVVMAQAVEDLKASVKEAYTRLVA